MAVKDSVKAIPLASFNAALLAPAVWSALTPAGGMPEPCFLIMIKNLSNRNIEISYDKVHVNDALLADATPLELDFQTNSRPNNNTAVLKKGTHIYVRGAALGAGTIYLSGYYQESQV